MGDGSFVITTSKPDNRMRARIPVTRLALRPRGGAEITSIQKYSSLSQLCFQSGNFRVDLNQIGAAAFLGSDGIHSLGQI